MSTPNVHTVKILLAAHWTERNFYNKDTHSFTKSQNIEVIVEDSNDEQSIDQLYKDDGSAFPKDEPPEFNFQDDIALLPYSSGKYSNPNLCSIFSKNQLDNFEASISSDRSGLNLTFDFGFGFNGFSTSQIFSDLGLMDL